MKIKITIEELKSLLDEQKEQTAKYITRNMSYYHWWNIPGVDIEKAREELKNKVLKSEYPNDFQILYKYLK